MFVKVFLLLSVSFYKQSEHGKKYKDDKEEYLRRKIFEENLKEINNHNAAYERGEVTFRKGANMFADMTKDEVIGQYTGLVIPNNLRKGVRKL